MLLRRLKDRSGLSLAALAAKTGYSRSSWERYLNGKQPVSRAAVEELAQVCGTEPTKLLVLHEMAAQARESAPTDSEAAGESGMAGAETSPAPEPKSAAAPALSASARPGAPPASGAHPSSRRLVPARYALAGATAAVAVAFVAGLLLPRPGGGDTEAPSARTYGPGRTYDCEYGRKDGAAYAGHSVTTEELIDINGSGRDVVEAQCLLKRHGFDPGEIDGLYGTTAKSAVREFQIARELVGDGIVGPDTWAELRR
ncbi:helix-turn-helix domain-containing protein [Streptomyces sp. NPDC088116]|uniref:helix-turn-helix domain-containing protein n=1 Tax=Streptomyces sp. NPDC088116 TaxID=3365825 RepID=UPI003819C2F5